jgi:putative hemolysin
MASLQKPYNTAALLCYPSALDCLPKERLPKKADWQESQFPVRPRRPFVKRPLVALMICIAFAIAVFLPAARPVQAGSANNVSADPDLGKAEDYCVKKGGEVDVRDPYYNTNDDNEANWFRLSGSRQFCKFTLKKDGSRIHVLLTTLYTEKPTLAALAYYAEVPLNPGCNGNPASCYCSQLGGSDLFGGINANGGGWVQKSDPIDTVLEACIFPDMSTIDSWGLTYHSVGIIRGKDLSKVLKYPNPYGTD